MLLSLVLVHGATASTVRRAAPGGGDAAVREGIAATAGADAPPASPGRVGADSALTRPIAAPDSLGAAAPAPARALGMADTVTLLSPVRVDADRAGADARAATTTVRMDRSRLARFQPSTTADALLAAPGLDVTRTGPWASRVALRGMSGERVLVLVDGVRLQSGRGHGAQTSLVPVEKLESVEMLPGSGGAEFGSDALAGVVELKTHRDLVGRRRATFTLSGRAGGPGDERGAMARLRTQQPGWGAELSAGAGGLGALVTPDGTVPHSGYHDLDLGGRVQARLGLSLVDLEHTRHEARDIELPAFSDAAGSSAEYPLQSREATRLEWKLASEDARREARVLGVHQRFRTAFVESVTDSQFLRGRFVGTRSTRADDRITTWSSGVQPSLRHGSTRLYGEYRHESTQGPRTTDVTVYNTAGTTVSTATGAGESVPPARRDVLAGGVASGAVWRALRLDVGARYDWLHSRADSTPTSFTPVLDVVDRRASLDAGLSARIGAFTPYVRAASGFRAPNLEERYYNNDIHGGMRLFGNPALRAEQSHTGEAGVRFAGAGRALESARLSVYRSDVDDLITLRYIGQLYLVPRFQYTNVREARLEGIELELAGGAGPLRLVAGGAFPRGLDRATGERLTDIGAARVTLDARTSVPRGLPNGMLAVRVRWTDATPADDPDLARPSFWTASLEASCIVRDTRLALSVRNLTDARYREPMSFIDEPGRTLMLSARRDFQWPL